MDNQLVLWNSSKPDSVLKKKTSSAAYHYVREGVSNDQWRTTYINTNLDPNDILTKKAYQQERIGTERLG